MGAARRDTTARHRSGAVRTGTLLLLTASVVAACSGEGGPAAARPLDPPGGAAAVTPAPTAPASTTPAPTAAAPAGGPLDTPPLDATPPGAPPGDGPPAGAGTGRAVVQGALDRYARALTDLSARPDALGRPGSAEALAWAASVVPGAALADDVAARVRARAADGVVVVPPAPGSLSWRFRALQVVPRDRPGPREWAFTWCSWSPGIGRSVATGAVVDDVVAHGRGVGSVREVDGDPRLASLDQTELDELPAGSPDPCTG